ncbi:MAG: ROK family protein [Clostridia bacterium]|nr:ROK family protein [Clostridia bacterium]
MKRFLGLDIGGTKCAVVKGDAEGHVDREIKFETTDFNATLAGLLAACDELFDATIVAIGVSCGGPLSSARGVIMSPPNLPGWDDVHIVEILEKRFGVPAFLKNDADACAIAEWKFGNARGYKNAVFLTFGTGMGAGLIINGAPYSGANDMAGEVGHIRLRKNGHIGYGKRGSFEGYCSGGGIAQYGLGSAKELAERARGGDKEAIRIFRKTGRHLGRGLAYIVDILNPEVIVIGSIFTRAEDLIRPSMERALKKEALSLSVDAVKILPAALGDSIGNLAALGVAFNGYVSLGEKI